MPEENIDVAAFRGFVEKYEEFVGSLSVAESSRMNARDAIQRLLGRSLDEDVRKGSLSFQSSAGTLLDMPATDLISHLRRRLRKLERDQKN